MPLRYVVMLNPRCLAPTAPTTATSAATASPLFLTAAIATSEPISAATAAAAASLRARHLLIVRRAHVI